MALLSATLARPAHAVFNPGECVPGLDNMGMVVAGGGDFNGDDIPDFAYSAPCARIGKFDHVGRVWIRNGKNGHLFRRAIGGKQLDLYFGAELAWVGDLDGDGKDELAVGTPFFDPEPDPARPDEIFRDVGLVRVLTIRKRPPLLRLEGEKELQGSQFGASITGIADINGDGVRDLVIAALNEKDPFDENRRKGALHFVSGADGSLIETRLGTRVGQRPGLVLRNLGPTIDGDAADDLLVTSAKNPVGSVLNAGFVETLSTMDPTLPIYSEGGAKNDELGHSGDSRGTGFFIVGSPGTRLDDDLPDAGMAIGFAPNGTRLFTVNAEQTQRGARFGEAVAALGDITGDEIEDYAVGAPFFDAFISVEEGFAADVGQLEVLSGDGGEEIFTLTGDTVNKRLARALSGGIELNEDFVPDIIMGSPGDSPKGRRGAGSVIVLSGDTFKPIRTFAGRRGLETRIFTFADLGGTPKLRDFDADGNLRELDKDLFQEVNSGNLSVSVMDESQNATLPGGIVKSPIPGSMRVAVGTGHRSTAPQVIVVRVAKPHDELTNFKAFEAPYAGGVTVAAGDLNTDGQDELVIAQADTRDATGAATGNVVVRVFKQLTGDPTQITGFILDFQFQAFVAAQRIGTVEIKADGANVAVGGLLPNTGREIVASPIEGAPAVRVFSSVGVLLQEWLAYDNLNFSGVNVAIGDLDNNGSNEIVTAPNKGQALIRVFTAVGTPFIFPNALEPTAFLAFPENFTGGARVATADIDFDGEEEILVAPGPGLPDQVLAFEGDGTPVEGFNLDPYIGNVTSGVQLSATDRFIRK